MNKILIVGHPQSGYEEVEALLNACGMAGAQPSRREGYLPQQISATLCKAHNASTLQHIEAGCDVQQIEVGPLWHGMALDLMLGNLDQEFWGWSDPQVIFLLDYWLSLDPAITFVFVYDQPQSVLTRMDAQSAAGLDPQSLQQRAQGWTAYNAALLHFFLRHPQRCLLVSSQQVRASAASYLQQMRARINAPWSERMDQLAGPLALTNGDTPVDANTAADSPALAGTGWTVATPHRPPSDALSTYLADALLSRHTASLQLYEELQSCANLPLDDEAGRIVPAALDAWQSMVARQREKEGENELLLNQLHQVQGELERHYLDAQQKAQDLELLQKAEASLCQTNGEQAKQLTEKQKQLTEQQQQLSQLQTELERERIKASELQTDLLQENELLLNQLHQVQEELERHYLDAQQKAQDLELLKKAEASLCQTSGEQAKQLTEKQKQLTEQQQQLSQLQTELERERIKASELQTDLLQENELLLNQLHQVQEELERYYLEAQKLKQKAAPAKPAEPVYYGAGQRIRQQLSYKLGATMIERSRSVGGWISMPIELLRVARQHKRELPLRAAQKLPPIHKYRDAHEAERHRNHLSYRLGQTLLTNASSPIGWMRLPSAIRREVREHRSRQSKD